MWDVYLNKSTGEWVVSEFSRSVGQYYFYKDAVLAAAAKNRPHYSGEEFASWDNINDPQQDWPGGFVQYSWSRG